MLADALKEAAPVLEELGESGRAELARAADQLRVAAEADEPSPQRLKGLLEWSKGALQEATGSALGALLVAAVTSTLALLS